MTHKYPSVTFRLDQETLNLLDKCAKLRNIGRSEYIKEAIWLAIGSDQDELDPNA
jgi:predicted transcriptional regulator